jgi:hypothetical protein
MAKATTSTKTAADDKPTNTAADAAAPSGMMLAEHIVIVSAPAGPRRRAGFGFGPVPIELRWDELGATDDDREAALNAIRTDPMLKLDGRFEERPVDD